MKMLVDK